MDTILVEIEGKFRLIVKEKVLVHFCSVADADFHIQRCHAVLPVLGNLFLGIGIHLADVLQLRLLILSLRLKTQ